MEDPREKATRYMEKHNIKQLFEELGTVLMYKRPENVQEFLLSQLKTLKAAKEKKISKPFFNTSDLETMFSMFDVTDKGTITKEQYVQALKNLGIEKPAGDLPELVTREAFLDSALDELQQQ